MLQCIVNESSTIHTLPETLMSLKIKHIALITGMVLTILSFTCFSININTYAAILAIGLIISFLAFCAILFQKDSIRNKLLWTGIVVIGTGIQWLSELVLIRLSGIILIKQNQSSFSKVNNIFLLKEGNATWVADSTLWERNSITRDEGLKIKDLLNGSQVTMGTKDSLRIYYMTYSRIDITHGISYYYLNSKPKRSENITGNWYH